MNTEMASRFAASGGSGAAGVEDFIDKLEVSRRLGTRPRTVDAWMRRGLLPYYKLGKAVRFKWSEVEVHLSHQCRVCRELTKAGL
jgi:excisionase family DNA binding protein